MSKRSRGWQGRATREATQKGEGLPPGVEWVFRPERRVGGKGFRAAARMLMGARKTTSAYLKKRGLEWPRIPWDEVEETKR
jgi:hypothetical protein